MFQCFQRNRLEKAHTGQPKTHQLLILLKTQLLKKTQFCCNLKWDKTGVFTNKNKKDAYKSCSWDTRSVIVSVSYSFNGNGKCERQCGQLPMLNGGHIQV